MRPDHRRVRCVECCVYQRGRAVGQVHHNAQALALRYHFGTQRRQAAVGWLCGLVVANRALDVMHQLQVAHADAVRPFQARNIAF